MSTRDIGHVDVRDAIVYATAVMILADTAITLVFWRMEQNPIVIALGPVAWTALKVGLAVALVGGWMITDIESESAVPVWIQRFFYDYMFGAIVLLGIFYTAVLVMNVIVISGL